MCFRRPTTPALAPGVVVQRGRGPRKCQAEGRSLEPARGGTDTWRRETILAFAVCPTCSFAFPPSRVACKDCVRWTATIHAESGRLPTLITCKSGSPQPRRGDVSRRKKVDDFRVKGKRVRYVRFRWPSKWPSLTSKCLGAGCEISKFRFSCPPIS